MTSGGKNNNCKEKPLLLVSALDWGLGHTARTIPLIRELLHLNCQIVIACNSIQKKILQAEFPTLRYEELEGYGLSYSRGKWATRLKIGLQVSKILTRIKVESRWLRGFLKENDVCALISDNRYGLSHPGLHSVFITHQLAVRTGVGRIFDMISQKILYKYINRFSECWVPDFPKNINLGGSLSHPHRFPSVPVHYLGALSRFEVCENQHDFSFDIVVILSGPEPQRTILENIMLKQLNQLELRIAFVRGLPDSVNALPNVKATVYNHLDSDKLNKLVCSSKLVVCRSGYSTIMDMIKLNKRMIMIPTPGQPEQEYLGEYLSREKLALQVSQHHFDVKSAIEAAEKFPYRYINDDMNGYKSVLKNFVSKISS